MTEKQIDTCSYTILYNSIYRNVVFFIKKNFDKFAKSNTIHKYTALINLKGPFHDDILIPLSLCYPANQIV